MKVRKNVSLSPKAVAKGEQIATETGQSLSAIIESQLLAIPSGQSDSEDYWSGPPLKPLARPGDARANHLKRKHA